MTNVDISLIIPVYNNADLLPQLIETIAKQSFSGKIECLFIDDNSPDNSLAVLEQETIKLTTRGIDVEIICDGENKKQGTRRNQGVQRARGKYVLFVDSDDFLHSRTLETCFLAAESEDDIDMVHFNFAFYSTDEEKKYRYKPSVPSFLYAKGELLVGEDCELLLSLDPYFTVTRLYNTKFLRENNITFGEGYFYEDFEFFVKSITSANKIKLLPNVFYYVRTHGNSTTQTAVDSLVHVDSYLKAITKTLSDFEPRGELSKYNVTKYFLNRGLLYTKVRMPNNKKIRKEYLRQILEILPTLDQETDLPKGYASPLYYAIFGLGYYQKKDVNHLIKIYDIHRLKPEKLKLAVASDRLRSTRLYNRIYKKIFKPQRIINLAHLGLGRKTIIEEKKELTVERALSDKAQILMLGFDYKYTGNSKYLFDFLINEYSAAELKFVTLDERVPEEYRIEPRSEEFEEFLAQSQVIIAESWVPLDFDIQDNQKMIQLWHGSPLKKMLYDSPEIEITRFNPTHKSRKKWDINRWDVLISDSPIATEKFETAFAIESDIIVETGYPRVKWLVDNKDNEKLKEELRVQLGIPTDKKVVLYLPTWREYNFKRAYQNELYQLNHKRFKDHLPADFDYVILEKNHSMSLKKEEKINPSIELPQDEDIQPYLLIADIVISDYSSVIFDCISINLPFYLLFKDYDLYKDIRDVYPDMMSRLEGAIAYSEKELAEILVNYQEFYKQQDYSDYVSQNVTTSYEAIGELINSYLPD